ncbi:hypothetical protein F8M41_012045 [Gigaspora margarita]|uniref:Granulins domain-containing protein n=1 Tax=Gigaspora margarita TaxID=4874 RepID=A0A8H4EPT5_GIGMA|nr:hypothetical protein F8M41_012045 [Gigaspora margarita]
MKFIYTALLIFMLTFLLHGNSDCGISSVLKYKMLSTKVGLDDCPCADPSTMFCCNELYCCTNGDTCCSDKSGCCPQGGPEGVLEIVKYIM